MYQKYYGSKITLLIMLSYFCSNGLLLLLDLQSRLILAFKAKVALMRASLHLRFVSRFLMTLSQLQDSFVMDG